MMVETMLGGFDNYDDLRVAIVNKLDVSGIYPACDRQSIEAELKKKIHDCFDKDVEYIAQCIYGLMTPEFEKCGGGIEGQLADMEAVVDEYHLNSIRSVIDNIYWDKYIRTDEICPNCSRVWEISVNIDIDGLMDDYLKDELYNVYKEREFIDTLKDELVDSLKDHMSDAYGFDSIEIYHRTSRNNVSIIGGGELYSPHCPKCGRLIVSYDDHKPSDVMDFVFAKNITVYDTNKVKTVSILPEMSPRVRVFYEHVDDIYDNNTNDFLIDVNQNSDIGMDNGYLHGEEIMVVDIDDLNEWINTIDELYRLNIDKIIGGKQTTLVKLPERSDSWVFGPYLEGGRVAQPIFWSGTKPYKLFKSPVSLEHMNWMRQQNLIDKKYRRLQLYQKKGFTLSKENIEFIDKIERLRKDLVNKIGTDTPITDDEYYLPSSVICPMQNRIYEQCSKVPKESIAYKNCNRLLKMIKLRCGVLKYGRTPILL